MMEKECIVGLLCSLVNAVIADDCNKPKGVLLVSLAVTSSQTIV